MTIIGLDISSSCVGISQWNNNNLVKYGFVDISRIPSDELFKKIDTFFVLFDIPQNVTEILVEESLKSFAYGHSSVDTMLLLTKINVLISYVLYCKIGIYPKFISAQTARKHIGLKINKNSSVDKKEQIFDFVDKKFNLFSLMNKNGKMDKRMFDISDAIVIGAVQL
ncbi:MAG: hypothetical protein WC438_05630 [Candidatus Pacearchaeota archaeon]